MPTVLASYLLAGVRENDANRGAAKRTRAEVLDNRRKQDVGVCKAIYAGVMQALICNVSAGFARSCLDNPTFATTLVVVHCCYTAIGKG